MRGFYIFANSKPNKYYKKNSFINFTYILPQVVDVSEGDWEIALCDLFFIKTKERSPSMFICCDIIQAYFTSEGNEQVLRFIPEMKGRFNRCFQNTYYMDIIPDYLDKIRIYIKTLNNENSSFDNETLYCTLHVREKL